MRNLGYTIKYAIQRILLMLLTLLIITLICFVLIRMLPLKELPIGDPHTDVILAQREAFGYNKPYLVQFGIFLKNIFTRFDWGISDQLYFGQNVGIFSCPNCLLPCWSMCTPSCFPFPSASFWVLLPL